MGHAQKARMSKREPRNLTMLASKTKPFKRKSKSAHGEQVKIGLLFCNMDTRTARKANRERVQVSATLRARKL